VPLFSARVHSGMQPSRPIDGTGVLQSHQDFALARDAWFRGDFTGCLALLGGASNGSDLPQREAMLLRCRALLRLHRAQEVIDLLEPMLTTFVGIDEACTARMLHATAVARALNLDRALALLADVATSARTLDAHHAIRAEIEYRIANVYWLKREHDAVLRHAIEAEKGRADVISVRAASLRGFVALARQRYRAALKLFKWSYQAYLQCKQKDRDLLEQIVFQIVVLEVALQSADVAATHSIPPEIEADLRAEPKDRLPGVSRTQIASFDSWLYAFEGERDKAYERARLANRFAPSFAWLVWSLANQAKLALAFGDLRFARVVAADAMDLAGSMDWDATTDDERVGLLFLAEALSVTDSSMAERALQRYDHIASEMDRSRLFHDDLRLWILETFVRGLIHKAKNEMEAARTAFWSVHLAAQRVGILWRSALALIELDSISPTDSGEHYLQTATKIIAENFPRSFLSRRVGPWIHSETDLVAAKLPRQPRQVLRHTLTGKNPKEIAAAMALSEDTIKGYMKTLFRAFSVNSTPQLLVECYRRGLGSPSWWDRVERAGPADIPGEMETCRIRGQSAL